MKIDKEHNLAKTNPTLSREWHFIKNGSLTPQEVAPNSHRKVWWLCSKNKEHEWQTAIYIRKKGSGCPYCSGKKAYKGNCLATVNPKLASEWHPTKNGKLTPKDVMPNSHRKVWWLCSKNKEHEWQATIAGRNNGSGCLYCSGQKVHKDTCLAAVYPKLAKEWHPTKNGKLTPKDVMPNSHRKVWWLCSKNKEHEWQASVAHRNNDRGCPYCSGKKAYKGNCLATVNPQLAEEWHFVKNGKLTPNNVTPGSNKKVWWLCSKNKEHEWQAVISSRNSGIGCPYCSGKKAYKGNCLATVNPKLAKEWHPSKNGNLTPFDVRPGSGKKVWWLCSKNKEHEWQATVEGRNSGRGCPKCHSHVSEGELRIYSEIKCLFKKTQLRKRLFGAECDIYVPDLEFAIEYDGSYWHRNKHKNDIEKTRLLEKKGIFLLRVRETGLKKIRKDDIILTRNKVNFKIIKNILVVILKEKSLNSFAKKRIQVYLDKKRFSNEKLFINLLDMLPGPFPGYSLIDKNLKLAKEWHPTKNGKLTPKNVMPNSGKKVWWLCSKNKEHEWQATVDSRSKGSGCPYCSSQRVHKGTCLATVNPKLAKEWHPTKNGKLTPKDVMPNSNMKVWWKCKKNHEWQALIANRNKGIGCPCCSGRRVCEDNCLAIINPKLAKEWHPTKNGNLTPFDVRPGSGKKVWWKCGKEHEWQTAIFSRSKGSGCPYCSRQRVHKGK